MPDDPVGEQVRRVLDGDVPETIDERTVVAVVERVDPARTDDLAGTLTSIAARDRSTADAIASGLNAALEDGDAPLPVVADLAAALVEECPDEASAVVPGLVAELESDYTVSQRPAAEALARIATVAPEAAAPAIPRLPPLLRAEVPEVREPAAGIALEVGEEVPERVEPLVPTLLALLTERYDTHSIPDEVGHAVGRRPGTRPDRMTTEMEKRAQRARVTNAVVREQAVRTLTRVVAADAATLDAGMPDLAEALEVERNPTVRASLVDLLGRLAVDRAAEMEAVIDPLCELLAEGTDGSLRTRATWALVLIAGEHGERVADAVRTVLPRVLDHLDAEAAERREAAVGLLVTVARHRPEALESAVTALASALDDDRSLVRNGAAWIVVRIDEGESGAEAHPTEAEAASGRPGPDVTRAARRAFDGVDEAG